MDITERRDVLIIFKERGKVSIVDSIIKKIKPVEEKVIDEAIEPTELGEGFEYVIRCTRKFSGLFHHLSFYESYEVFSPSKCFSDPFFFFEFIQEN